MRGKWHQGLFRPRNPKKYKGDPTRIVYRSSWELRCMSRLDMDPQVAQWASEELAIPYRSPADGRVHRYFPDFLIKKTDGSVHMVEIKPEHQTRPPVARPRMNKRKFINEVLEFGKNEAKWVAARAYCENRGWQFSVLTERDLGIKF